MRDYQRLRQKQSHQDNGKYCIIFKIVEPKQWVVINGTATTVSKIRSGIALVVTDIALHAKVRRASNG